MSVFLLVLGLLLFVGLVVVHEFGHFIVARRNGVDVEEFGIGFPPRAYSRKTKKGFLFTINWLPIGGFVRLKGENDASTEPHSFGAATLGVKAKIMLAGVALNLLAALVIFTALAWVGMPQLLDNQFSVKSDTHVVHRSVLIGFVEPGSPAEKAHLQARDQLISIGLPNQQAKTVQSANDLPNITKQYGGQIVQVNYKRGSQTEQVTVHLRTPKEAKDQGALGIAPADYTLTRATWSAPVQAAGVAWQFTAATFKGLGTALSALFRGDTGTASQQVSGPVGIVVVLHAGSLLGYQFVLLIVGLISLSLAIMNILPIPALDGGRFYVLLLSRMFGKTVPKETEERIVGTSFVLLLLLIALITVVDVKRYL
ncbi:MAG TPA: M50 family metallopeptidase [Patescibacteria group bacterium]|nr:M50 family metallopeptidase [Patescibacteria group bacterium]